MNIEELNKFRTFNKLKSVYRLSSVDTRKESSAEHTWSCLVLADYFLSSFDFKVDRLKVYELLMYHDVVEIETGDFPLQPGSSREDKQELEKRGAKILSEKIPLILKEKYLSLFEEFEEQKTLEARFAKAIDALDSQIHEMDYKEDWKGWSKEFLVSKKGKLFDEFPGLKEAFETLLEFLETEGFFDQ